MVLKVVTVNNIMSLLKFIVLSHQIKFTLKIPQSPNNLTKNTTLKVIPRLSSAYIK